jgi:thioredoxin-like negative regulator of GroEL
MKPVVDRLQQQYQGKVDFKLYDVDSSAEGNQLMGQFNAKYVPTFVFVNKDGTVAGQKVGETPEDQMTAALDALK